MRYKNVKYWILAKRRASPGYARDHGFGSSGKFVLSRFHGRFSIHENSFYALSIFWRQLTGSQVARSKLHPGDILRRKWECYVIKRFVRKSRISPRIPDFSGFLLYQVTQGRVISEFRKTKLYKNPLRIVGGDSK